MTTGGTAEVTAEAHRKSAAGTTPKLISHTANPIQDYKKQEDTVLKYRYDTQLLIDGENLSDDRINEYISHNIEGDCLLAIGDEDLIKIHFHTNTPWKVLEYCASFGEIYDIVIEDMERQSHGLKG